MKLVAIIGSPRGMKGLITMMKDEWPAEHEYRKSQGRLS